MYVYNMISETFRILIRSYANRISISLSVLPSWKEVIIQGSNVLRWIGWWSQFICGVMNESNNMLTLEQIYISYIDLWFVLIFLYCYHIGFVIYISIIYFLHFNQFLHYINVIDINVVGCHSNSFFQNIILWS